MNAIAQRLTERMSGKQFLAFLDGRPDDELWQLIDGIAVMMNPPTWAHQVIAMNLAMLLNAALHRSRPELMALVELGVSVPERPEFLPRADVAVVNLPAEYISYAPRFYLTAEILSASNTQEYTARKMLRYSEHPDNLHALVVSQRKMRVELRSRSNAWKPVTLTSPDDALELPEFGFRCVLRDLYSGTPLA